MGSSSRTPQVQPYICSWGRQLKGLPGVHLKGIKSWRRRYLGGSKQNREQPHGGDEQGRTSNSKGVGQEGYTCYTGWHSQHFRKKFPHYGPFTEPVLLTAAWDKMDMVSEPMGPGFPRCRGQTPSK